MRPGLPAAPPRDSPGGKLSDPCGVVETVRPVTDLERKQAPFHVVSESQPSGDQPAAIEELTRRVQGGEKDVVLLGATGTGKSATTAWLIERLQRPTLVLAPN